MWLSNTTPCASNQHQPGVATQFQTPAQSQIPDATQSTESSTAVGELSLERARDEPDEHQESKPEAAQEKEETMAPTSEQGKSAMDYVVPTTPDA